MFKLIHGFSLLLILFLVSACGGASVGGEVVSALNRSPVANAGPDMGVRIQGSVTLDGTASRDPDGNLQSYRWEQQGDTIFGLAGSDTPTPTFEASVDTPQVFVFELTVTDSLGETDTDTVRVLVSDITVNVGDDQSSFERERVFLSSVVNSSENITSYSWSQVSGTSASILNSDAESTDIVLPSLQTPENLSFELTAVDATGATHSDIVNVFVDVYPSVSELNFVDPALQNCLTTIAANNGLQDVNEFTEISCPNVNNIKGLFQLQGLTSVKFPNSNIENLDELVELVNVGNVTEIDLTGNNNIPCEHVERINFLNFDNNNFILSDDCRLTSQTLMSGGAHDFVIDEGRAIIYVTVPERKEIILVDLNTRRKTTRIPLPGKPWDIALSKDGLSLYVALNGSNAIAIVSLNDFSIEVIPLGASLDENTVANISELEPGKLLVTANTGTSGGANIVQVILGTENIVSRVIDGRITRGGAVIVSAKDGDTSYIAGETFPNRIYKLDSSTTNPQLVSEFQVGNYSSMTLNADDTKLFLSSGQIFDTETLNEIAVIQNPALNPISNEETAFVTSSQSGNEVVFSTGRAEFSPDGQLINYYDFDSLQAEREIYASCQINSDVWRLSPYSSDQQFVLVSGDKLCITGSKLQSQVDAYPNFHFRDVALEKCILQIAETESWNTVFDFTDINCENSAQIIESAEGLSDFVNLDSLNLSNSQILDISSLLIPNLKSLILRNAATQAISRNSHVFDIPQLDVTGSSDINCAILNTWEANGVDITADVCSQTLELDFNDFVFDLEVNELMNTAYVSVPTAQTIHKIDLSSFAIETSWLTDDRPRGLDLSVDESTLYTAFELTGTLAYIDTQDGSAETVDIATLLDENQLNFSNTYDVLEISPDRVLVSSSPGSGGFAYIVEVRRDLMNAAKRVAEEYIIRTEPRFSLNSDSSQVYVSERTVLHKLDALSSELPIIKQEFTKRIGDVDLTTDDANVLTAHGEILESTNFTVVGALESAVRNIGAVFSKDKSKIFTSGDDDNLKVFDANTYRLIGYKSVGCDFGNINQLLELDGGEILLLGSRSLCMSKVVAYNK